MLKKSKSKGTSTYTYLTQFGVEKSIYFNYFDRKRFLLDKNRKYVGVIRGNYCWTWVDVLFQPKMARFKFWG